MLITELFSATPTHQQHSVIFIYRHINVTASIKIIVIIVIIFVVRKLKNSSEIVHITIDAALFYYLPLILSISIKARVDFLSLEMMSHRANSNNTIRKVS